MPATCLQDSRFFLLCPPFSSERGYSVWKDRQSVSDRKYRTASCTGVESEVFPRVEVEVVASAAPQLQYGKRSKRKLGSSLCPLENSFAYYLSYTQKIATSIVCLCLLCIYYCYLSACMLLVHWYFNLIDLLYFSGKCLQLKSL